MKALSRALAMSTLALTFAGGLAFAQDHYVRHNEWKKGYHMQHDDWARGQQVADWHTHHLRKPPAGYEWRMVDGQYVCANSDGVILSVVVPH